MEALNNCKFSLSFASSLLFSYFRSLARSTFEIYNNPAEYNKPILLTPFDQYFVIFTTFIQFKLYVNRNQLPLRCPRIRAQCEVPTS